MKALSCENLGAALESYRRHETFFPLIGAVLEGRQDGQVYADAPTAPTRSIINIWE